MRPTLRQRASNLVSKTGFEEYKEEQHTEHNHRTQRDNVEDAHLHGPLSSPEHVIARIDLNDVNGDSICIE